MFGRFFYKKVLPDALILCSYLVLTVIFTFPLIIKLKTHIPGDGGDSLSYYWKLWWFGRSLLELKTNPIFCNYIFYPFGSNLGLDTFIVFNGILSIPLQVFFNLAVSYNVIVLLSFVLSAYGCYLLANYLVRDRLAAFIAGLVFSFCPYKFAHLLGHMELISTEWMPFYVFFLIRSVRERAVLKNCVLAGISFVLTVLCSYYYAAFLLLFTAIYWGYLLITEKAAVLNRVYIKGVLIMAALILACLSPLLYSVRYDFIYDNHVYSDLKNYTNSGADPAEYFLPSYFQPVFRKYLSGLYSTQFLAMVAERNISAGYVLWFIFLFGLYRVKKHIADLRFWYFSALVFFVISLGPQLRFLGKEYGVVLPSWILIWIPLFDGLRAHIRFALMFMLCLSIITAYVASWLLAGTKHKKILFSALALLISFEYLPAPYPMYRINIPEIYDVIAEDKGDFTVLDVPLGWHITTDIGDKKYASYQFRQTRHGKRIISGNISRGCATLADTYLEMPFLNKLYLMQQKIPVRMSGGSDDQDTVWGVLRYLKIKYIILHYPGLKPGIREYLDSLKFEKIHQSREMAVYRIEGEEGTKEVYKNTVRYMYGWHAQEPWDGEYFVHWSRGNKSVILVDADKISNYRIKMRAIPFPFDSENQCLKLYVNGRYYAEQRLKKNWNEYVFTVPEEYWKIGENTVKFRYKYTSSPRKVFGSNDSRLLSLAVNYFKVLPAHLRE